MSIGARCRSCAAIDRRTRGDGNERIRIRVRIRSLLSSSACGDACVGGLRVPDDGVRPGARTAAVADVATDRRTADAIADAGRHQTPYLQGHARRRSRSLAQATRRTAADARRPSGLRRASRRTARRGLQSSAVGQRGGDVGRGRPPSLRTDAIGGQSPLHHGLHERPRIPGTQGKRARERAHDRQMPRRCSALGGLQRTRFQEARVEEAQVERAPSCGLVGAAVRSDRRASSA